MLFITERDRIYPSEDEEPKEEDKEDGKKKKKKKKDDSDEDIKTYPHHKYDPPTIGPAKR